MKNLYDFIKFCTEEANVDKNDNEKLIEFIKRAKRIYLNKLKYIPLYFLGVLLILLILNSVIIKKFSIIGFITNMYPFIILVLIVLAFVLLLFYIEYLKCYFNFENKLQKITSIKKSNNKFIFIRADVEYVTDDTRMIVITFKEKDSNPEIKYSVGLNHPNIEHDIFLENHTYILYLLDNKKLFIIDEIYL